jgi:arginine deiminase
MFSVTSEVGRLRRVMVHRPGLELERLTPANKDDLLFDEVLWVRRARQEHDAFADALRERDVEVLYLTDLLAETLKLDEARSWVMTQTTAETSLGPTLSGPARAALEAMDPQTLTRHLVGGSPRKSSAWRCTASCWPHSTTRTSCCRHCRTTCSPGTARRGCTAG